jgi:hypothetical protein
MTCCKSVNVTWRCGLVRLPSTLLSNSWRRAADSSDGESLASKPQPQRQRQRQQCCLESQISVCTCVCATGPVGYEGMQAHNWRGGGVSSGMVLNHLC